MDALLDLTHILTIITVGFIIFFTSTSLLFNYIFKTKEVPISIKTDMLQGKKFIKVKGELVERDGKNIYKENRSRAIVDGNPEEIYDLKDSNTISIINLELGLNQIKSIVEIIISKDKKNNNFNPSNGYIIPNRTYIEFLLMKTRCDGYVVKNITMDKHKNIYNILILISAISLEILLIKPIMVALIAMNFTL